MRIGYVDIYNLRNCMECVKLIPSSAMIKISKER